MRPIDADARLARWRAAMLHMVKESNGTHSISMETLIKDLENAPTLDYKDLVPQGEWIVEKIVGRKRTVRRICSLCGYDNLNRKSNFCPNCGARMKGE